MALVQEKSLQADSRQTDHAIDGSPETLDHLLARCYKYVKYLA